ncbi:MAG: ROK family protein [Candidatus Omnitrophica bacterium]|nr:ROK family protein [Candidatus Omnitrophota bacterium]
MYADRQLVKGVDHVDPGLKQEIYGRYLAAFRKGVFDYVREDLDPVSHEPVPRKYFSGGVAAIDQAQIAEVDGALPETFAANLHDTFTVRVNLTTIGGDPDAAVLAEERGWSQPHISASRERIESLLAFEASLNRFYPTPLTGGWLEAQSDVIVTRIMRLLETRKPRVITADTRKFVEALVIHLLVNSMDGYLQRTDGLADRADEFEFTFDSLVDGETLVLRFTDNGTAPAQAEDTAAKQQAMRQQRPRFGGRGQARSYHLPYLLRQLGRQVPVSLQERADGHPGTVTELRISLTDAAILIDGGDIPAFKDSEEVLADMLADGDLPLNVKLWHALEFLDRVRHWVSEENFVDSDTLDIYRRALTLVEPPRQYDDRNLLRAEAQGGLLHDLYLRQLEVLAEMADSTQRLLLMEPEIMLEDLETRILRAHPRVGMLTGTQYVSVKTKLMKLLSDQNRVQHIYDRIATKYPVREYERTARTVQLWEKLVPGDRDLVDYLIVLDKDTMPSGVDGMALIPEARTLVVSEEAFMDAGRRRGEIEVEHVLTEKQILAVTDAITARRNINFSQARAGLDGLRERMAPIFTELFGEGSPVPRFAYLRPSPTALVVEMDNDSLLALREASTKEITEKVAAADIDRDIDLGEEEAARFRQLRELMQRYPEYIAINYHDELIAYLTGGVLRTTNVDGLLEYYRRNYQNALYTLIDATIADQNLRDALFQEARTVLSPLNPRWSKIETAIRGNKALIDRLVDKKASLIIRNVTGGEVNLDESMDEVQRMLLEHRAYREASHELRAVLQFIPPGKMHRLSALEERLDDDIRVRKSAPTLTESIIGSGSGTPTPGIATVRGFARTKNDLPLIVQGMGQSVWVREHEVQHVINSGFTLYTSAGLKTPGSFNALWRRALRGKAVADEALTVTDVLREYLPEGRVPERTNVGRFQIVHAPWRTSPDKPDNFFEHVVMPFDEGQFFFGAPAQPDTVDWRFDEDTVFWEGQINGTGLSFIEQRWPYALNHFLIVPQRGEHRPQVLTEQDVRLMMDIARSEPLPGFRLAFNSLKAGASINHLHLHGLTVPGNTSALEQADLVELARRDGVTVKRIEGDIARGLYFTGADPAAAAATAYQYIQRLQDQDIAHTAIATPDGLFVLPVHGNIITSYGMTWSFYELMGFIVNSDTGRDFSWVREEHILAEMKEVVLSEQEFNDTYRGLWSREADKAVLTAGPVYGQQVEIVVRPDGMRIDGRTLSNGLPDIRHDLKHIAFAAVTGRSSVLDHLTYGAYSSRAWDDFTFREGIHAGNLEEIFVRAMEIYLAAGTQTNAQERLAAITADLGRPVDELPAEFAVSLENGSLFRRVLDAYAGLDRQLTTEGEVRVTHRYAPRFLKPATGDAAMTAAEHDEQRANVARIYAGMAENFNVTTGQPMFRDSERVAAMAGMFSTGPDGERRAVETDIYSVALMQLPQAMRDWLRDILVADWLQIFTETDEDIDHFIPERDTYHISVSVVQDLAARPDEAVGVLGRPDEGLTEDQRQRITEDLRRIIASQDKVTLTPVGARLGPDGTLIFVFEYDPALYEIRAEAVDAVRAQNAAFTGRPKPMVHVTLSRTLNNPTVTPQMAEMIARFRDRYTSVTNADMGLEGPVTVTELEFSHEKRWMHTEIGASEVIPLGGSDQAELVQFHPFDLLGLIDLDGKRLKAAVEAQEDVNAYDAPLDEELARLGFTREMIIEEIVSKLEQRRTLDRWAATDALEHILREVLENAVDAYMQRADFDDEFMFGFDVRSHPRGTVIRFLDNGTPLFVSETSEEKRVQKKVFHNRYGGKHAGMAIIRHQVTTNIDKRAEVKLIDLSSRFPGAERKLEFFTMLEILLPDDGAVLAEAPVKSGPGQLTLMFPVLRRLKIKEFDKGSQTRVFSTEAWDYVLKVLPAEPNGVFVIDNYERFRPYLGGLVPAYQIVRLLDTFGMYLEEAVVMEKISGPNLLEDIRAAYEAGDMTTVDRVLSEFTSLLQEIYDRGLLMPDVKLVNFKKHDGHYRLLDAGIVLDPAQFRDGRGDIETVGEFFMQRHLENLRVLGAVGGYELISRYRDAMAAIGLADGEGFLKKVGEMPEEMTPAPMPDISAGIVRSLHALADVPAEVTETADAEDSAVLSETGRAGLADETPLEELGLSRHSERVLRDRGLTTLGIIKQQHRSGALNDIPGMKSPLSKVRIEIDGLMLDLISGTEWSLPAVAEDIAAEAADEMVRDEIEADPALTRGEKDQALLTWQSAVDMLRHYRNRAVLSLPPKFTKPGQRGIVMLGHLHGLPYESQEWLDGLRYLDEARNGTDPQKWQRHVTRWENYLNQALDVEYAGLLQVIEQDYERVKTILTEMTDIRLAGVEYSAKEFRDLMPEAEQMAVLLPQLLRRLNFQSPEKRARQLMLFTYGPLVYAKVTGQAFMRDVELVPIDNHFLKTSVMGDVRKIDAALERARFSLSPDAKRSYQADAQAIIDRRYRKLRLDRDRHFALQVLKHTRKGQAMLVSLGNLHIDGVDAILKGRRVLPRAVIDMKEWEEKASELFVFPDRAAADRAVFGAIPALGGNDALDLDAFVLAVSDTYQDHLRGAWNGSLRFYVPLSETRRDIDDFLVTDPRDGRQWVYLAAQTGSEAGKSEAYLLRVKEATPTKIRFDEIMLQRATGFIPVQTLIDQGLALPGSAEVIIKQAERYMRNMRPVMLALLSQGIAKPKLVLGAARNKFDDDMVFLAVPIVDPAIPPSTFEGLYVGMRDNERVYIPMHAAGDRGPHVLVRLPRLIKMTERDLQGLAGIMAAQTFIGRRLGAEKIGPALAGAGVSLGGDEVELDTDRAVDNIFALDSDQTDKAWLRQDLREALISAGYVEDEAMIADGLDEKDDEFTELLRSNGFGRKVAELIQQEVRKSVQRLEDGQTTFGQRYRTVKNFLTKIQPMADDGDTEAQTTFVFGFVQRMEVVAPKKGRRAADVTERLAHELWHVYRNDDRLADAFSELRLLEEDLVEEDEDVRGWFNDPDIGLEDYVPLLERHNQELDEEPTADPDDPEPDWYSSFAEDLGQLIFMLTGGNADKSYRILNAMDRGLSLPQAVGAVLGDERQSRGDMAVLVEPPYLVGITQLQIADVTRSMVFDTFSGRRLGYLRVLRALNDARIILNRGKRIDLKLDLAVSNLHEQSGGDIEEAWLRRDLNTALHSIGVTIDQAVLSEDGRFPPVTQDDFVTYFKKASWWGPVIDRLEQFRTDGLIHSYGFTGSFSRGQYRLGSSKDLDIALVLRGEPFYANRLGPVVDFIEEINSDPGIPVHITLTAFGPSYRYSVRADTLEFDLVRQPEVVQYYLDAGHYRGDRFVRIDGSTADPQNLWRLHAKLVELGPMPEEQLREFLSGVDQAVLADVMDAVRRKLQRDAAFAGRGNEHLPGYLREFQARLIRGRTAADREIIDRLLNNEDILTVTDQTPLYNGAPLTVDNPVAWGNDTQIFMQPTRSIHLYPGDLRLKGSGGANFIKQFAGTVYPYNVREFGARARAIYFGANEQNLQKEMTAALSFAYLMETLWPTEGAQATNIPLGIKRVKTVTIGAEPYPVDVYFSKLAREDEEARTAMEELLVRQLGSRRAEYPEDTAAAFVAFMRPAQMLDMQGSPLRVGLIRKLLLEDYSAEHDFDVEVRERWQQRGQALTGLSAEEIARLAKQRVDDIFGEIMQDYQPLAVDATELITETEGASPFAILYQATDAYRRRTLVYNARAAERFYRDVVYDLGRYLGALWTVGGRTDGGPIEERNVAIRGNRVVLHDWDEGFVPNRETVGIRIEPSAIRNDFGMMQISTLKTIQQLLGVHDRFADSAQRYFMEGVTAGSRRAMEEILMNPGQDVLNDIDRQMLLNDWRRLTLPRETTTDVSDVFAAEFLRSVRELAQQGERVTADQAVLADPAADARLISEIEPIEQFARFITDIEDLDAFVEAPLLEAARTLFKKGIRTFWTSANRKDIAEGSPAVLMFLYDELSPRNKLVSHSVGQVLDNISTVVRIPMDETTTVADIHREAMAIVNRFEAQPMDRSIAEIIRPGRDQAVTVEEQDKPPADVRRLAGVAFIFGTGNNATVIDADGNVRLENGALTELGHNILKKSRTGEWVFTGRETLGAKPDRESGDVSFEDSFSGPNIARRFAQTDWAPAFIKTHVTALPEGFATHTQLVDLVRNVPDDENLRKLRAAGIDVILRTITAAVSDGDAQAISFVNRLGREIGVALAAWLKHYAAEDWTQNIVLVSGVGEHFARIEGETDDTNVFIGGIRAGVTLGLAEAGKTEGLRYLDEARIQGIARGIRRSTMGWERELLAARFTEQERSQLDITDAAPQDALAVGISLGGTKIGAGLISMDGNILARDEIQWRQRYHESSAGIVEGIVDRIANLLTADAVRNLRKVGIAFAGPVDRDAGVVGTPFKAPNLPFENYPLRQAIRERLLQKLQDEFGSQVQDLTIDIYNDNVAAAIGEQSRSGRLNAGARDEAMQASAPKQARVFDTAEAVASVFPYADVINLPALAESGVVLTGHVNRVPAQTSLENYVLKARHQMKIYEGGTYRGAVPLWEYSKPGQLVNIPLEKFTDARWVLPLHAQYRPKLTENQGLVRTLLWLYLVSRPELQGEKVVAIGAAEPFRRTLDEMRAVFGDYRTFTEDDFGFRLSQPAYEFTVPVLTAEQRSAVESYLEKFMPITDVASDGDAAVLGTDKKGGIDFNPVNMNLSEQGDDIPLNVSPILSSPLGPIEGIRPVIIQIVPVTNLPLLLGLTDKPSEDAPVSGADLLARDPADRRALTIAALDVIVR